MNYLKSTILIGFLAPLILLGAIIGGAEYGFSWIGGTYQMRAEAYAQLQADKGEEETLRVEVLPNRGAIAYFEGAKSENFDEKLPAFVSELCDSEFDGLLIRNSLDLQGDGGVSISLTGRYDAMQKFIAKLGSRFLFLETESISLTANEPDANIPSRHVAMNYTAKNQQMSAQADTDLGLGGGFEGGAQ